MKKSKTKLAFSKRTISSLENISGGRFAFTSESCPGADCVSERHSCNPDCSQNKGCD